MREFLHTPKIDSFKVRFPVSQVRILDNSFNSKYQKIYIESGEIEEEINLDKHKCSLVDGISFRCGQAYYQAGKDAYDCIYMQVNAKMLRNKYFQGITANTIYDVYYYIMDLGIVHIPFTQFLGGMVSDVDICFDFEAEREDMVKSNYVIYKNVLPSLYKYVGKPFGRKDNTGIMFNVRAKATPTKPYIKIYHKTTELLHKSTEFAEAYLKRVDFSNIGRIEYTIKNSRHKKKLKTSYTTLEQLLNMSKEKMKTIITSGIPNYVKERTMIKEFSALGPKDALLHYFLDLLIQKGCDKYQIYQALDMFEDAPVKKHRIKKLIDDLIDNVDDQNRLISNEKTMNILRQLDLDFLS